LEERGEEYFKTFSPLVFVVVLVGVASVVAQDLSTTDADALKSV
jgi:hypothetical protein